MKKILNQKKRNIMNDYIKKDNIEYKIYKRCRVCRKDSLYKAYPEGALLIFKNEPGQIRVVCRIKTDYGNVRQIINEIAEIELPEAEGGYNCLSIVPSGDDGINAQKVKFIVKSYNLESESTFHTKFYRQYSEDGSKLFIVCVNVINGDDAYAYEKQSAELAALCEERFKSQSLTARIQNWCKNTTYNQFKQAIENRVKGQANLRMVLINVYQYLNAIAKKQPGSKFSMILAGPSGCGKTETMRALKEYFAKEIPGFVVSLIDMNQITSEGFKGNDTNYLVSGLKAGGSNGIGIVFLDEFDKRLSPAYDSCGTNVNGDIQHQLLEAIEGYVFQEDSSSIDTSKTMFIGLGSFDEVRKRREEEVSNTKKFGFGAAEPESDPGADHFEEISRKDMIELGACYEIIGRFGQVVNYGPLSYEAIDSIIDMRVKAVSDIAPVKVSISKEMRAFLHENANTEYGNRLLDSLLRETSTMACADMYEKGINASEIVLTGEQQYKIIARRTCRNKNKEVLK